MLEAIRRFFQVKQRTFEATCSNGLCASYMIALRRGEGGPRDEKLAKRLKVYGDKLERKRNGNRGNVVPIRRAQ